jgi:hypothetical protein
VPLDRVRLTEAKSGLGHHRKLRLARPQGSDSGSAPEDDELRLAPSPDPRARTRARPRKTTNCLARPQGSAPEDDELRLARPQGSDSALALADDLRLARPKGSDSASTSEDRLDPDLGGASASPYPGLGLTTPQEGPSLPYP